MLVNLVEVNSQGTGDITAWFTGFIFVPVTVYEFADVAPQMNNSNALPLRLFNGRFNVSARGGPGSTNLRAVALGYYRTPTTSTLRFRPVPPCVIFDTRANQGATGVLAGPRSDGQETVYDLRNPVPAQGAVTGCAIPASAEAVELNLVALNAIREGNLRAFAYGSQPTGGVLNFGPLDPAMNNANAITVPVSSQGWLSIETNGGPAGQGLPLADVRGVLMGYYD
ncbi:MAG: hypothetical protein AB8G14_19325 [Ilumatobacter sp.]